MGIKQNHSIVRRMGAKTIWHPYTLQSLSQRQFVSVVDKILKQEYRLLSVRPMQPTGE